PMTGLTVRPVHLHHSDTLVLEIPGDTNPIRAGALHTNQSQLAVRTQPRHQLSVSDAGRGERLDTEHTSHMVHNSSHVGICVSVDTADHGIGVSYDGHCHPSLHIRTGVARTCRTGGPEIPGPGANRT